MMSKLNDWFYENMNIVLYWFYVVMIISIIALVGISYHEIYSYTMLLVVACLIMTYSNYMQTYRPYIILHTTGVSWSDQDPPTHSHPFMARIEFEGGVNFVYVYHIYEKDGVKYYTTISPTPEVFTDDQILSWADMESTHKQFWETTL